MPYQQLVDLYQYVLKSGDPRMNNRPLIASPMPTILSILAYLYFVKIAGPKWMKHREAFSLRTLMIVYNFAMVAVSTYMFIEMGRVLDWGRYCLKCQKMNFSTSEWDKKVLDLGYLFFLSKFAEFVDTIFFVLRKKDSQISALHVYHHSVVPLTMWAGCKFELGGNNSLFPFLNSGVHMIMYTYYGLSAIGPQFQKYLFWKRYMTTLQLAQFVIVLIHSVKNFYEGCEKRSFFLFVNFFHAAVFFYLFSTFYKQSYAKKLKDDLIKENIKHDKKYIKGQMIEDKTIGENGLRLRTIKDENSNVTIASYSGLSISVTKKNEKSKDK